MSQLSHNKQKHTNANPLMRIALDQFHLRVRAMLPPAEQILEVGCGEGFSAAAIFDAGVTEQLYGGDLSLDAVLEARTRYPHMRYMTFDASRLPLADKSVELTFSLEVLEHLPDPASAIREIRRVTRRYALLSVPNDPVFRALRFMTGKGLAMWGDHPEHVQHWATGQFVRFLRQQSLKVLSIAVPFPYAWTIVLVEI